MGLCAHENIVSFHELYSKHSKVISDWSHHYNCLVLLAVDKIKGFFCVRILTCLSVLRTFSSVISVNSSHLSAAYMRQWIGSALVQIMARRLFGAKPLSKPMLACCQFYHFHSRKCNWKCRLPKCRPFCLGGNELRSCYLVCHICRFSMID